MFPSLENLQVMGQTLGMPLKLPTFVTVSWQPSHPSHAFLLGFKTMETCKSIWVHLKALLTLTLGNMKQRQC
jgi:hypothetical protein